MRSPTPLSLPSHLLVLDCSTAVWIGPLMAVVRQADRKLSWDITIFSPLLTLIFRLKAAVAVRLGPLGTTRQ